MRDNGEFDRQCKWLADERQNLGYLSYALTAGLGNKQHVLLEEPQNESDPPDKQRITLNCQTSKISLIQMLLSKLLFQPHNSPRSVDIEILQR